MEGAGGGWQAAFVVVAENGFKRFDAGASDIVVVSWCMWEEHRGEYRAREPVSTR